MGTTDCWVSCSAAVSTLGCPLLCSDEGGAPVISVSRADDLKSLGNQRTRVAFAPILEAGVADM